MDTNYNIGVENVVRLGPPLIFILSTYLYITGSISFLVIGGNELRNNIAYVFQEPVIFEKTILENIKFLL